MADDNWLDQFDSWCRHHIIQGLGELRRESPCILPLFSHQQIAGAAKDAMDNASDVLLRVEPGPGK